MKKIILFFLLSVSLNAFADDCSKVNKSIDRSFYAYKNTLKYEMIYSNELDLKMIQWLTSKHNEKCSQQAIERVAINAATEILNSNPKVQHKKVKELLNYINQKGMIRILDEEQRQKFNKQNILGAYSCKKDLIWLSPDNKPFNQGTVLIHEISHWARSLVIQNYKNTNKFNGLPKALRDKESYFLFDESLSSIEAAYRQLSYRDVNFSLSHDKNALSYKKSFTDLNLFNPIGNFINLWHENHFSFFYTFKEFYKLYLLRSQDEKYAKNIFKLTQQVYSPNSQSNLSEEVYSLIEATIESHEDLNSPIDWILQLDIKEIEKLDKEKDCSLNLGNNHGGEGVGLDDGDLQLSDSDLRTCLKPIKEM